MRRLLRRRRIGASQLGCVGFLLLLAPPIGSATTAPAIVLIPPYTHPFVDPDLSTHVATTASGSGAVSQLVPPFFNGTSGIGGFDAKVNLTGRCSGPCRQVAEATANLTITLPIGPLSTFHRVTVRWSYDQPFHWVMQNGWCHWYGRAFTTCTVETNESFVIGAVDLVDRTTHTSNCLMHCVPTTITNSSSNTSGALAGYGGGSFTAVSASYDHRGGGSSVARLPPIASGDLYGLIFHFGWSVRVYEQAQATGFLTGGCHLVAQIGSRGHPATVRVVAIVLV